MAITTDTPHDTPYNFASVLSGLQPNLGSGMRWRHFPAVVYSSSIITVPPMGDSITEGTIATILKEPDLLENDALGDSLAEDEVIAQIDTDKVTIDVRYTSSEPAKVAELLVKEQDTVEVGQPIVKIEQVEGGEKPEGVKQQEEEEKQETEAVAAGKPAPPPPKPKEEAPAPKAEAPSAPAPPSPTARPEK